MHKEGLRHNDTVELLNTTKKKTNIWKKNILKSEKLAKVYRDLIEKHKASPLNKSKQFPVTKRW